jgi:outer membrane receptor protein involved in Fe transport
MSTAYADDTSPPKTVAAAVHEELAEVTVTATRFNTTDIYAITKIPERVIDTSQSIKVFSADELEFADISTLSDLGNLDSGEYTTPL